VAPSGEQQRVTFDVLTAANTSLNKWTHYIGIRTMFLLCNSNIWSSHFDCVSSPVVI